MIVLSVWLNEVDPDGSGTLTEAFGASLVPIWVQIFARKSIENGLRNCKPCFGSGRIRILWSDPDPLQETLIRIRVAKKIVTNSHKNQPKF